MDSLNFIVCPSYHGATLLSLLLNNHSRIVSLGDSIPGRQFLEARCSCTRRVSECPFWTRVLEETGAGRFTEGQKVLPLWPRLAERHQRLNRLAAIGLAGAAHTVGPSVWGALPGRRDEFKETYARFYAAVRETSGAEMFVDGSKSMSKAFVLSSMYPDARTRIVHVVRDPRDYHCSNVKNNPGTATVQGSIRRWRDRHMAIIGMAKMIGSESYLRIRYEDLCERPEDTLRAMFDFFGVEYEDVFHRPQDDRKNHVIGNVSMARFDGTIRASSAWRSKLSESDAKRIARGTRPLIGRFGYEGDT